MRHNQIHLQNHVVQAQSTSQVIPLNIARYRKAVNSALWVQVTLVVCHLLYGIVVALTLTFLATIELVVNSPVAISLFTHHIHLSNEILYFKLAKLVIHRGILGCKESHFYSLPFGQAEVSIYQPKHHFNKPPKFFDEQNWFHSSSVS